MEGPGVGLDGQTLVRLDDGLVSNREPDESLRQRGGVGRHAALIANATAAR
jgi:hypothetical protein